MFKYVYGSLAVAASTFVLLIATFVQFYYPESIAIARSGCIIVFIGIVSIVWDINVSFAEIEKRVEETGHTVTSTDWEESLSGTAAQRAKMRIQIKGDVGIKIQSTT